MVDRSRQTGFDSAFLDIPVSLPTSGTESSQVELLHYTHFSVLLNRRRRLAELTAVNIDGAALTDVPRGDDWHLDARLPASEQVGPDLYARNDLDRGHLVRRRDPVWEPDAASANFDTFCYTNAAPQVNVFNQSKELWLGLEDYLLATADAGDSRLSVFTGPVFEEADPLYRGVQLPRQFWKIAAWASNGVLASTGYLLDQGALLDRLTLPSAAPAEPGAFGTFQVSVSEIAILTGLGMDVLSRADRLQRRTGMRPGEWIPLHSYGDIRGL